MASDSDRAQRLWELNYGLIMSVVANVADGVGKLGLDMKELFLLAKLDDHPHPAALAKALVMPKPTVTVYVKRLEAAGFIRREIDTTDLRRHRLTLTASGRRATTAGMAQLTEAFRARLERISPKQHGVLLSLFEKMADEPERT